MTLQDAYIHLQQGLQTIAAFVGRSYETWQMDYLWYTGTNKFVDLCIPNKEDMRPDEKYSDIQASIDDLRAITVANATPNVTKHTEGGYTVYKISLPTNYRHLINDRSITLGIGCTGNGGVVPNRLVEQDDLYNILENKLYKTVASSPVSKIDDNKLYVYASYKGVEQFTVNAIFIDYIKNPTKYTFATDSGTTIEFPENVVFKIIKTTLIYAATIAEQNPNKIQLLERQ